MFIVEFLFSYYNINTKKKRFSLQVPSALAKVECKCEWMTFASQAEEEDGRQSKYWLPMTLSFPPYLVQKCTGASQTASWDQR